MRMLKRREGQWDGAKFLLTLAVAGTTGCASIPDGVIRFQPVDWSIGLVVSHVLTCGKPPGSTVVSSLQVEAFTSFAPVYRAGSQIRPLELRLKEFSSPLADSDINIQLTDDGRLKSINHNSTGQGETIFKAGVAALSQAKAGGIFNPASSDSSGQRDRNDIFKDVCALVVEFDPGHNSKVTSKVILQHFLEIDRNTKDNENLKPIPGREWLVEAIKKLGLDLSTRIRIEKESPTSKQQQFSLEPSAPSDSYGVLKIQQTGSITITPTYVNSFFNDKEYKLPGGKFQIPLDEVTTVLIPRPQPFGSSKFSLELADSGRVTKIGYSKGTGATGLLNATGSAAGAQTAFDTAEAAALKAAADAIAQRLRLQNCIDKPTECK